MRSEYLVRMANDISRFFAAESGEQEEAARNVLTHLKRFWDPRMRARIVAYYREGGTGLTDIAARAVAMLADETTAEQG
ncbi:MAG: formate dehydrogenase subunit delta [Gammaproteobacteria bacterium]